MLQPFHRHCTVLLMMAPAHMFPPAAVSFATLLCANPCNPPYYTHAQAGILIVQLQLGSVSPAALSLAGGLPLTLTLSGPGLLLPGNPAAHTVTLGGNSITGGNSSGAAPPPLGPAGLSCPVLNVSSDGRQLTCRAPPLTGLLLAEFWNLPEGLSGSVLPPLEIYMNPGEQSVEW